MKPTRPPLTALQRKYAQATTAGMAPEGLPVADCTCGARYLDTEGGWDAHLIVFGHQPGDRVADVEDIGDADE